MRHGGVEQDKFVEAYLTEIKTVRSLTGARSVSSIFFGGGTPSLMDVSTVQKLIDAVDAAWGIEQGAEITLEANPTSYESQKFFDFKQVGINRVSLGVQSLQDEALKWLGRQHSAKEAIEAVISARQIFDRVSFDLIYARQNQSLEDWARELKQAIAYHPDHLSLYQLTIEPGTAFHRLWQAGSLTQVDDDIARAQFDLTQEETEKAGLPAYEISNHAKLGEESRHNLIYWRGLDYAGIGPGAHGRIEVEGKRIATVAEKMPEAWVETVKKQGHGYIEETSLDKQEIADERLIMGLRLADGLNINRLKTNYGLIIDLKKIEHLFDLGFLTHTKNDYLCVTKIGRPVLNSLICEVASASEYG